MERTSIRAVLLSLCLALVSSYSAAIWSAVDDGGDYWVGDRVLDRAGLTGESDQNGTAD